MKKTIFILAVSAGLIFSSCKNEEQSESKKNETTAVSESTVNKTETVSETATGNFVNVAEPVMYSALIKGTSTEEIPVQWTEKLDIKNFTQIVFDAVYAGKVTAYGFQDSIPMTIEQVKEFEKKYPREEIGKVFFRENWSVDKDNLSVKKVVNSYMFAYERANNQGDVTGYKAGITIYLNGTEPKVN